MKPIIETVKESYAKFEEVANLLDRASKKEITIKELVNLFPTDKDKYIGSTANVFEFVKSSLSEEQDQILTTSIKELFLQEIRKLMEEKGIDLNKIEIFDSCYSPNWTRLTFIISYSNFNISGYTVFSKEPYVHSLEHKKQSFIDSIKMMEKSLSEIEGKSTKHFNKIRKSLTKQLEETKANYNYFLSIYDELKQTQSLIDSIVEQMIKG